MLYDRYCITLKCDARGCRCRVMSSDSFKAATTLLNMPLRGKKNIIKDLLKNFLLETRVVCTLCHIEDRGHLPGGGGFHLRLYTVSSRVVNYATVERQSGI